MNELLVAALAGAGAHFLVGALLSGRRDVWPRRSPTGSSRVAARRRTRDWMVQAGLVDVRLSEFVAVSLALFAAAALTTGALFGGLVPAVVVGTGAATVPFHLYRSRRAVRLARAQEAWPRLIDEIRLRTLSLGRSVPQALIEVGLRAPVELRPAFEAAQREWLLSVDFARTLDVLRAHLADPTADATCETLLVAHEVGGTDLAHRLEALAEDRRQDALGRKDARAKQAGVRFARRFVLVVPIGMALAGSLIGEGRSSYASPAGQAVVLAALAMVAGCWAWAGRYLRLPQAGRVFRAPFEAPQSDASPRRRVPVGPAEPASPSRNPEVAVP